MVALLGVLLHPLQLLLVTLEAPGVVLELWGCVTVAALQAIVEHLGLLHSLHVLRLLMDTEGCQEKTALTTR